MSTKDRLYSFIDLKKISPKAFEGTVGLGNGFVSKVGFSIRKEKLDLISNTYPELNINWLLTGEGDMLKNTNDKQIDKMKLKEIDSSIATHEVPLLPVSAQGGSLDEFVATIKTADCEKIISPIKNASFAITVAGDSMAPEYPSGSQVLIKKINENAFIEWGKVYVLDTCNGIIIKRLIPSEKEGYLKCLSDNNPMVYAPFDVRCNDIFGVYKVMLCMSIK